MQALNDHVSPGSITDPLQASSETFIFEVPFAVLVECVSYVASFTTFFLMSATVMSASIDSVFATILYSLSLPLKAPLS